MQMDFSACGHELSGPVSAHDNDVVLLLTSWTTQ